MKNLEIIGWILHLNESTERSIRGIAAQVNKSPKYVKHKLETAKKHKLTAEMVYQMDPDSVRRMFYLQRRRTLTKRMPDWSYVHQQMQATKNATLMQLWYEYCLADADTAYSYPQFTHYYRKYVKKVDLSMRQTHYPGEVGYVDFAGKTLYYIDPKSGQKIKVQIFVAVLGFSQYAFACAVHSQNQEDWIECHNHWFFYLDGVPRVVTPDNLKAAVIKTGKRTELNKIYKEMARHYNCSIIPARVRKPQDKSLAEIGVLLVTRWIIVPLSRREFFSLEEINQAISELLPIINQRKFKRYPGNRLQRFTQFDKPVLKSLPKETFEYAKWFSTRRVNSDYHVDIEGHFYSVPFDVRNEFVEARVTNTSVQLIHNNKVVATHPRSSSKGEATTDYKHGTAEHQYKWSQTEENYLDWASRIGEYASKVIQHQFHGLPSYSTEGVKACESFKRLSRRYGADVFEKACRYAFEELKSPTVTRIENVLRHKRYEHVDQTLVAPLPEHNNVRGGSYYEGGSYA